MELLRDLLLKVVWDMGCWAFLVAQTVKTLPAMQVQSLDWKDPLEKGMAAHSSILAWRIHGQRSLVAYSPWNCKESDTTD